MHEIPSEPAILQLSAEIIYGIGALLDVTDAGNLRLTCRRFKDMFESTIFQEITLNVNRSNLAKSIPKLRTLAAGRSPGAARTTTRLILSCFSPSYDPTSPSTLINSVLPPEVAEGERRLRKYLFDAIATLKHVNTVSWKTHESDNTWTQNTIIKAVKGLPHLESFSLDATFLKIVVPIQRLDNLLNFDISAKHLLVPDFFEQTCRNIAKLFTRNSHIISLRITPDESCPSDVSQISLRSLFHDYPRDAPPLRLQKLTLSKISVRLDVITLPHLQYLKSLDLSYIADPDSNTDTADSCANGKGLVSIWTALTDSGIHLEEISLNQPTASFLGFIERYSGLRKITLSTSGINAGAESERLGTRFWTKSLHSHRNTLQMLHVDAIHGKAWCLGDHNLAAMIKCAALISLSTSISTENISHCTDGVDSESIVTRLIDNISCYRPRLRFVALSLSPLTRMEKGDLSLRTNAPLWLRAQVQSYVAPPLCRHLPDVTLNFPLGNNAEQYWPERAIGDAARIESGEWHYVQITT